MDFGSLPSDLWLGLSACFTIKWVTLFGVQVPILVNIFWCLMGALIGTADRRAARASGRWRRWPCCCR